MNFERENNNILFQKVPLSFTIELQKAYLFPFILIQYALRAYSSDQLRSGFQLSPSGA